MRFTSTFSIVAIMMVTYTTAAILPLTKLRLQRAAEQKSQQCGDWESWETDESDTACSAPAEIRRRLVFVPVSTPDYELRDAEVTQPRNCVNSSVVQPTCDVAGQNLGCFVDNPRALRFGFRLPSSMTKSFCLAHCKSNGFRLAGLELGVWCWCSNVLHAGNEPVVGCKVPCAGDKSQNCGGAKFETEIFCT